MKKKDLVEKAVRYLVNKGENSYHLCSCPPMIVRLAAFTKDKHGNIKMITTELTGKFFEKFGCDIKGINEFKFFIFDRLTDQDLMEFLIDQNTDSIEIDFLIDRIEWPDSD